MTPEHWQRVKQLLQSALERKPNERSAFVAEACAGDESLRKDVEELIISHEQAGSFIEEPPLNVYAEMLADEPTESLVGQAFGAYRILSQLGAGGMGEVYLAQDNRLGRKVALKLLPSYFTQDQDRLRRFQQEARAASALNHPNILTIHEIGQIDDHPFIATEFIDGQTLREHTAKALIKLEEALDVAAQVASALAAAHKAGIIHRDIKPENIMIRHDGFVKVLDFGLVKLIEKPDTDSVGSTLVNTEAGVVMGTAHYMSPEQARGKKVDARTDIWSLGVVTYEMVTGHTPFEGGTPGDVLSLILQREPAPLVRYSPEVPAELERIIRKALHKDREERYQTVKDFLIDLKNLRRELEFKAELERSASPNRSDEAVAAMSSDQAVAGIAKQPAVQTSLADAAHPTSSAEYIVTEIKHHKQGVFIALGTIVILAVVWYLLPRFSSRTKVASTPLGNATFTQLTDQSGPEYFPSLSPDGKSMIYASYAAGNWDLYLQRVGGKNSINLTKDSPADDTQPAFSPDGELIAFRSEREGGGIFVMGATGESVKRLTDFGDNPAWSPDGKEIACADESIVEPGALYNPDSRIWAVNVATGERRLVTKENSMQPNWSPHGVRVAYWGRRSATAQRDIWTIPAGGGEPVEVTNDPAVDWNPVWSPDGKYLYFASDRAGSTNLWRVPVEEQTGKVLGPPEAVTTPSPYSAHLSFSRDGRRIVYAQFIRRVNIQQLRFDPAKETVTGQPVWITEGSRRADIPDLSPDDEWLAFCSIGEKQEDLFVIRRDGTSLRQLTDDIYKDRRPRWSPDGKRIAFFSDRSGKWEIWMINSDGSGLHQLTYTTGTTNSVWSPDGTRLACLQEGVSTFVIEVGKPWQEQSPQRLPPIGDSSEWRPSSWSPDGRKLAGYKVRAGATNGIFVYSFESQQYEKLTDFGLMPVWLSDSRRILFQDRGRLYLVDSQSKKVREALSVAPHYFGYGATLSHDDRVIYFSLVTTEADIWLMTLE
jgi:Tol biopolymer transport system component